MSRNTALLMACAILLIVANLVGRDGAVAKVASSDRRALAVAMDGSDRPLTRSNPWAADRGPGGGAGGGAGGGLSEPVQPVVVDDYDADAMADEGDDSGLGPASADEETAPDQSASAQFAPDQSAPDQSASTPDELNETSFDPRVR